MQKIAKNKYFFAFFFLYWSCFLAGCSEKKSLEKYPVIDVAEIVGVYQRVYCSDYFSSIELIPLETNNSVLVGGAPVVLVNDSLIFVNSIVAYDRVPFPQNIHVFNHSGKFLNQIGSIGRGPSEFLGIVDFFLNHEEPIVYVADHLNILEYGLNGNFIGSFDIPKLDGNSFMKFSYLEDGLFIGAFSYNTTISYKYCLFDRKGDIVECFPARFISKTRLNNAFALSSITPFRLYNQLYVMDFINDTLYTFINKSLQPAYVFDFGKYSYPTGGIDDEGKIEIFNVSGANAIRYMRIISVAGTPKYLFYNLYVPTALTRPIAVFRDDIVLGIYNIADNTNILLDTDQHLQKGLINDINGGLSFFPKYYAGNGVVVDIWQAEDIKEILTEEYFASIEIKDQEAHQKLRELLENLDWEDNPVVVLAKLKQ